MRCSFILLYVVLIVFIFISYIHVNKIIWYLHMITMKTCSNCIATVCFNQFHLLSNSRTDHLVYESTSDLLLCSTAPGFQAMGTFVVVCDGFFDFSIVCFLVSIYRILMHCWASASINHIHVLNDSRIMYLTTEGMSCVVLCSTVLVKSRSVGKFVIVCDTSFR